jgi:hypothetical protein
MPNNDGFRKHTAKNKLTLHYEHDIERSYQSPEDAHYHDLMCAILEQAVLDWRALDCGKRWTAVVYPGPEVVQRATMESFFKSEWFERLLEQALPNIEPETVRKHLHIPEPERRVPCATS